METKLIEYHLTIKIKIKGKAPEPKDREKDGNFPYLPLSFYEYIQDLATYYENQYKKDGYFTVVSLTKD